MAKYRKKRISLYEAMTQSRRRSRYSGTLEKLRGSGAGKAHAEAGRPDEYAEKTDEDRASEEEQVLVSGPAITAKWRAKPRTVQFNTGRIEFSMSYPVAAAIVLGIILLVLLAFRAGQYYSFLRQQSTGLSKKTAVDNLAANVSGKLQKEAGPTASTPSTSAVGREVSPAETKVEFTASTGGPASPQAGNVIVLVQYSKRADLVPVQRHFAQFGIETEIVSWAGKYFLITTDRFESFGIGSDGYKAKQRIVEVGALYKGRAPEGYETFAPRFFRDAYGKKVE